MGSSRDFEQSTISRPCIFVDAKAGVPHSSMKADDRCGFMRAFTDAHSDDAISQRSVEFPITRIASTLFDIGLIWPYTTK
jgi:hypothetical protein